MPTMGKAASGVSDATVDYVDRWHGGDNLLFLLFLLFFLVLLVLLVFRKTY